MRRIRYTCWAVCFMVLCLATAAQASETEPVVVPSPEAGWSGPFRLGAGDVLNADAVGVPARTVPSAIVGVDELRQLARSAYDEMR